MKRVHEIYSRLFLFSLLVFVFIIGCAKQQELYPQENDGKYGYVNTAGEVIIPYQYEYASAFSGGFARVEKNKKAGIIDTKGNLIIPLEYEALFMFQDGLALARKQDLYGYINQQNKVVVPFIYFDARDFNQGLARVKKGGIKEGEWGMIDLMGKVVVDFKYEVLGEVFREGMLSAKKDGLWGFVSREVSNDIPFEYEQVLNFSEGLAGVKRQGKYGYINKKNQIVIPFEYDNTLFFMGGVAPVQQGKLWGFINKKNELVLPIKMIDVGIEKKQWLYRDKNGNEHEFSS